MSSFDLIQCQNNGNQVSTEEERYVSKMELAELLSVSERTIEKNSRKIAGRVKVGKSVRYYLPDIHRVLLSGRNLFGNK